ncbi:receptor-like serine/threonine-protein kinase SD1-8 [Dendrobium catenatum]|uniref:receptor-like serine/threonine-protein kinase SD1-8 n=1 Tax=Dendrobium catenatum TaxID=906689 RepID=UPI0009F2FE61|nr:receptor-like serine/threonine-protein kinase SD1-8 [Dendrobium catenatum]
MKTFLLLLLFLSNLFYNSFAGDTLTPNSLLKDGQTLISAGGFFKLGFFSPGSSTMKYLGIWYMKIPVQTVVWVANRDSPLSDSLGSLKIGETGNLILFDGLQRPIWSTTATSNLSNPIAQLLDNGNFVLRNNDSISESSESYIWESFYNPSDTLLPGMKLGWNLKAGLESKLTTWNNSNDPSNGDYTFNLDLSGSPEMFLRHGSQIIYRNGPWTGFQFSGEPEMDSNSYISFDFISNQDEIYYTYKVIDSSVTFRLVLNQSQLQRYIWYDSVSSWSLYWYVPRDQCDSYAECGPYGFCNSNYSPVCRCVQGFKPKNPQNWNLRDGSDGCVRVTKLDCEKEDGFLKMSGIKLPDTTKAIVIQSISLEECRLRCLKNCSCLAYASANISAGGTGCITWGTELIDLKQFIDGGQDFYIRLAASELRGNSKKKHIIILVVVIFSMLMLLLGSIGYCLWKKKKMMNITGYWRNKPRQLSFDTVITGHLSDDDESRRQNTDLPLFNFETILIATENFSIANKIGEGGFGIVYKGKLVEGQEIAVKRLSKSSLQGLEEFKNEVKLIAKLQHINLVRLLGCCIQGEENMLVYEYMQNRSLDTIIFDKARSPILSWPIRFKIIIGIARGLVYLHQDSRFRIIHRDLKASNILLDKEMNPKISDFGLARIFGGEETNAYTKRVMGTYGYMSPEYAMDGIFSVKSDVFSFGVLVLEIVSGKKNKGIHISDERINLLAYAWNLWKEGKLLELFDASLGGSYSELEVLRCIHLGLLCVQERADDRPSMPLVLLMLSGANVVLPQPKNPGFWDGERSSEMKMSWSFSANDMSVTKLEGR